MKDFRKTFKDLYRNHQDYPSEYAALAIMKAMTAKSNESRVQIASNILETMFTRVKNLKKLENGMSPYQGMKNALTDCKGSLFFLKEGKLGNSLLQCLETDWEKQQFDFILSPIWHSLVTKKVPVHKKYIYFFVRDDLSPSYQAVQLAHASWEACHYVGKDGLHDVNFVVCSETKENIKTLAEKYRGFREPDMNNEYTCAYTPIIPYENKNLFAHYKLLNLPEKKSVLQNNSYEHVKINAGLNFGNVPELGRTSAI